MLLNNLLGNGRNVTIEIYKNICKIFIVSLILQTNDSMKV